MKESRRKECPNIEHMRRGAVAKGATVEQAGKMVCIFESNCNRDICHALSAAYLTELLKKTIKPS